MTSHRGQTRRCKKCVLVFPTLFLVLLFAPIHANGELIGYWNFDANTAADSSGNDLDGTLNGTAGFSDDVPAALGAGKSLALAESGVTPEGVGDYVDLGNPSILNFSTNDFTVAGWVKTAQADRGNIFSNGGDDGGGIRYVPSMGEGNDNKLTLTTDDDSSKVQTMGDTVLNDGVWHHIATVRGGDTFRVYVDGVEDGTAAVPAGYDLSGTSQKNAYIGVGISQSSGEFQKQLGGLYDDIAVWNEALSADHIAGLADGSIPVVPEPSSIALALLGLVGLVGFGRRLGR